MENKERVSVCRVVEDLFNYPFEDNSMEENEIAEMTTSLDFLYLQMYVLLTEKTRYLLKKYYPSPKWIGALGKCV